MQRITTTAGVTAATAVALAFGPHARADLLGVDLAPADVSITSPLYSGQFGVTGSLGVEVERDGDGKLSDAGLCSLDLLVESAGVYALGLGSLRVSNIGIFLDEKGEQDYFFNETSGVPQPGDYAGFLETGAIAGLTGELGIDLDGDGTEEAVLDFSEIEEPFRVFSFEALITRDGGSEVYTLTTDFSLTVEATLGGQVIPVTIEYSGVGMGVIPAPASWAALALAGLAAARRRR